jgi:hypothetical protein
MHVLIRNDNWTFCECLGWIVPAGTPDADVRHRLHARAAMGLPTVHTPLERFVIDGEHELMVEKLYQSWGDRLSP